MAQDQLEALAISMKETSSLSRGQKISSKMSLGEETLSLALWMMMMPLEGPLVSQIKASLSQKLRKHNNDRTLLLVLEGEASEVSLDSGASEASTPALEEWDKTEIPLEGSAEEVSRLSHLVLSQEGQAQLLRRVRPIWRMEKKLLRLRRPPLTRMG